MICSLFTGRVEDCSLRNRSCRTRQLWHDLFLVHRKGGGLLPMEQELPHTSVVTWSVPCLQEGWRIVPHGTGVAAHVISDMICSLFTGRVNDCSPWNRSSSSSALQLCYDLFLIYRKDRGLFPMEQELQHTSVFSISQPGKQREYSLVPESITSEEQRYWSSMVFCPFIKNKSRIPPFYCPWSLLLVPSKRDKTKREKGRGH